MTMIQMEARHLNQAQVYFQNFDYSFGISLSLGSKMRASQLLSSFYKNVGRMHTANRRLCYQGECRESNQGSGQCSIINEDLEGAQDRRQEKEDICKALK